MLNMAAHVVAGVKVGRFASNFLRTNFACSFRGLQTTCARFGIHEDFQQAKTELSQLKEDPGNDVKLKIYALFKQATEGKNTKSKPGVLDFVGKAKWEAWSTLGDMNQDEAKNQYIKIVNDLKTAEGGSAPEVTTVGDHKYEEIIVKIENGRFSVTLNRPKKKNAINFKMYDELVEALEHAASDNSVRLMTITGAGDFYCSGNDLGNFANVPPDGVQEMAINGGKILNRFVSGFIDFPKPIIALVNGPAVGVSVTIMGLFDAVFASDRATFHTPFTILGQSPEGCSSVVFPKIMGNAKACDLLLFNRKITAQEAYERNLVSRVFPDQSFRQETENIVRELAKLPKDSLRFSKHVVREVDRELLKRANDRECEVLVGRWQSPECMQAIMDFFTKK